MEKKRKGIDVFLFQTPDNHGGVKTVSSICPLSSSTARFACTLSEGVCQHVNIKHNCTGPVRHSEPVEWNVYAAHTFSWKKEHTEQHVLNMIIFVSFFFFQRCVSSSYITLFDPLVIPTAGSNCPLYRQAPVQGHSLIYESTTTQSVLREEAHHFFSFRLVWPIVRRV